MNKGLKWYDFVLQILLALLLFSLFLSSSVFITLAFRPLYYLDVSLLDIPGQSGYTAEEIRRNYDALIDYNLPLYDGELSFPDLAMSEHGKQHFAEVKDIFDVFKAVAIVSLPLCAVGIFYFHRHKNKFYLPLTAGLTVGLPLLGDALIALNWDQVFVTFHKLFFSNDYWIFDPRTDPVITILPDEFFLHCAVMILCMVVCGGAVCLAVYLIERKKQKQ